MIKKSIAWHPSIKEIENKTKQRGKKMKNQTAKKTTKADLLKKAKSLNLQAFKSWTCSRIKDEIKKRKESLINQIDSVISHHEKWSRSYFWTPPGSASSRRSSEKQNSFEVPIHFDGDLYYYESSVTHSCRNVYYTGTFEHNDKKKNVRLFKALKHKIESL